MRITNQPITPPMAQIITVSRLMGMSSASTRLVRKRRITPSMALMMSLRIQSPLGISSCHPRREAVVAPGQDLALRPFLLPSFTGLPINNVLGNSECEREKKDRGMVVPALLCSRLVALQERYCPGNFLLALSTAVVITIDPDATYRRSCRT